MPLRGQNVNILWRRMRRNGLPTNRSNTSGCFAFCFYIKVGYIKVIHTKKNNVHIKLNHKIL